MFRSLYKVQWMRRLLPCCLKGASDGESERAPLTSPPESREASFSSGSSSTPPPLQQLKSTSETAQASTAADGEQFVDSLNAFGARLFVQLGQRVGVRASSSRVCLCVCVPPDPREIWHRNLECTLHSTSKQRVIRLAITSVLLPTSTS